MAEFGKCLGQGKRRIQVDAARKCWAGESRKEKMTKEFTLAIFSGLIVLGLD